MKKYLNFIVVIFILFVFSIQYVGAQSASNSSTTSSNEKDVQNLKEKIAQKVEEIIKKDEKAYAGFITLIKDKSIKIKNIEGEEKNIEVDDVLTKYFLITGQDEKKDIKFSELKKGDYTIVTGPVDEKKVSANFIYKDTTYELGSGKVIEIDSTNSTIRTTTLEKNNYLLTLERSTSQQIINIKTLGLEKLSFSKIKVGDSVHFVAKRENDQKLKQFTATKILLIPQEYFEK